MKTIVLLHGLGTGSAAWQPQVDYFASTHRVLTPDLPGFGSAGGVFSFSAAVEVVHALLDSEDTGPAVLCGLSLGSLVALDFALTYPEMVERLIVVAGFASLPEELRSQQLATAELVASLPEEATVGVVEQLTAQVAEAHRESAKAALASLTPSSLAALLREVAGFDVRDRCDNFIGPSFVAWGSRDELNAPLCQDLAQRLPAATTHVINDAGHVANLDNPTEFDAMFEKFLGLPEPSEPIITVRK